MTSCRVKHPLGLVMTRNYCALGVFMTRIVGAYITTVRTRSRHRGVMVARALRSSAGMIAVTAVVLSACSTSHADPQGPANLKRTFATTAQVLEAVKAAQSINELPNSVGFLTKADWSMATGRFDCHD